METVHGLGLRFQGLGVFGWAQEVQGLQNIQNRVGGLGFGQVKGPSPFFRKFTGFPSRSIYPITGYLGFG